MDWIQDIRYIINGYVAKMGKRKNRHKVGWERRKKFVFGHVGFKIHTYYTPSQR